MGGWVNFCDSLFPRYHVNVMSIIKFTQTSIMSIQQTTIKATSVLTILCLSAALTITSCGKKATETTTTSTTTEATTKPEASTPATGASTAPSSTTTTTTTATGAGAALTAAEKTQLTPVKTALVMANTAIKGGDVSKAKTQFTKFTSLWPTVEPIVKAKAGANYEPIASGIETVKTAMSAATPDKAKAGEGLTKAIAAMNAVLAKK
jgi:iron uptake system EfeUOB component EfeO/EfeM